MAKLPCDKWEISRSWAISRSNNVTILTCGSEEDPSYISITVSKNIFFISYEDEDGTRRYENFFWEDGKRGSVQVYQQFGSYTQGYVDEEHEIPLDDDNETYRRLEDVPTEHRPTALWEKWKKKLGISIKDSNIKVD